MTAQTRLTSRQRKNHQEWEARSQLASSLLRRALHADKDERRELHAQVIELHLDVAESVASRYQGRGQDHEDLVQVARLGLVEAVQRFDPDRGPFLAFATSTMSGLVKRHFRDHGWVVRPPRSVQERLYGISSARSDLMHSLNRQPTTTELASRLNLTEQDVRAAINTQSCYHPTSLDAPIRAGSSVPGPSYAEMLGQDQPELANIDTLATITPACQRLTPADRHILYLRFFLQYTQNDIGAELGLNQMQVSRRLHRILTHLKATIGELETPSAPNNKSSISPPNAATPTQHPRQVTTHNMAA